MIVVTLARKPIPDVVARNILQYATGGLNIDETRIKTTDKLGGGGESAQNAGKIHEGWQRPWMKDAVKSEAYASRVRDNVKRSEALGRWPANLILEHKPDCQQAGASAPENYGKETVPVWVCAPSCPIQGIDTQSGFREAGHFPKTQNGQPGQGRTLGQGWSNQIPPERHMDAGGASRFFKIVGGQIS